MSLAVSTKSKNFKGEPSKHPNTVWAGLQKDQIEVVFDKYIDKVLLYSAPQTQLNYAFPYAYGVS